MPVYADSFGLRGLQIAGLWEVEDKFAWKFYDDTIKLKDIDREKAIAMAQYFDLQVFKKWYDQRSSIDKRLEASEASQGMMAFDDPENEEVVLHPITAGQSPNKILKDGMTRLMLICANKSGEFFWFIASGKGTSTPTIGQKGLDDENARVDMRVDGHMDAFGNILFFRARFGTLIATADIREFAGCDQPEDPSKFAWRVVLPEAEKLVHIQFERWYNASHYLIASAK